MDFTFHAARQQSIEGLQGCRQGQILKDIAEVLEAIHVVRAARQGEREQVGTGLSADFVIEKNEHFLPVAIMQSFCPYRARS